MKKIIVTLMTLLLLTVSASAQRGLSCYLVFQGKVVPGKQMVVTEVRGSSMAAYKLDFYRGVSFQVDEALTRQVAVLVEADAEKAEETPARSAQLFSIHKNRRRNLWISTMSIAASLVLIATVALKFIPMPSSTPVEQQKAETTAMYTPDNYNEDLMNYTMVDNVDVYYYLASEDFGE